MNQRSIVEIVFKATVIAGLLIVIALQFDKKESIVYVDSIKLVNGYKGMQAARKELEMKSAAWKANLDTLRTELEGKIKEYEAGKARLGVKEKALTEELIRTKQEQYMNYQNIIAEKIQKEDQELTTKVLGKVNDYIKKYGEDKGYAIIMAATQYGNIVYAEKGMDITDQVLEGLNKELTN
ncbi:OmpH family outer membrane protein [Fulvivirgaceae bacterium PWU4]|uniref:OmpH family outer membrane protein n=1 Tax=Chryseosolibacter histidini TaxID=2782349 RepID=A0AAP2DN74_9BACT|nr:OmpH family outer membrane protein [Chryseosolibacter histidini]MBT1697139.1 OmpH family outer membrane protein [Chryseosolibacter histidini]